MQTIRSLLPRIAFVLLVLSCGTGTAQQPQANGWPSVNYGFVSPNTREGLKLKDAINGLDSAEELALLNRAKSFRCTINRQIATIRALGSWSDGAEHSILLRVLTDEPTMRYLMSRLGRDANQKAVIYFHPGVGNAKIYILHPAKRVRSFATIARLLDDAGISFRTLVPTKEETTVYIIDTENSLATKVKTAAKRLEATVSSQPGNASFIGDDSVREKGQAAFAQEIKNYESTHPALPPPCVAN